MLGMLGAIWGVGGISLLFGSALFRLYPHAQELWDLPMEWVHWALLAANLVLFGYVKGYKVLHLRFAPRVAARALYLKNNSTLPRILFAPLFCMGYFHAPRKRKIVSYCLTVVIIGLIILVRQLEQPWRGIIDAGVVFALGWGLVSIWIFALKAFFGEGVDVSPETPEQGIS